MKKPNYVPCQMCNSHRNNPDYNFHINPCKWCNNVGTVIDPKEILCNNCGTTMCPLGTSNEQIPHGLYNAKVTGGFDSYHLMDMVHYKFSICEKCLRHLFMSFKIPPITSDLMGFHDEKYSFKMDQENYEYRLWRDNGGHHQAYINGKCNVEKDCPNDAIYTHFLSKSFTEDCSCEEHKEMGIYGNTVLVKFIPNNLKAFL